MKPKEPHENTHSGRHSFRATALIWSIKSSSTCDPLLCFKRRFAASVWDNVPLRVVNSAHIAAAAAHIWVYQNIFGGSLEHWASMSCLELELKRVQSYWVWDWDSNNGISQSEVEQQVYKLCWILKNNFLPSACQYCNISIVSSWLFMIHLRFMHFLDLQITGKIIRTIIGSGQPKW